MKQRTTNIVQLWYGHTFLIPTVVTGLHSQYMCPALVKGAISRRILNASQTYQQIARRVPYTLVKAI